MYGVTEIKKQNVQKKADAQHEREASFIVRSNGSVWLYNGPRTKILEKGRDDSLIAKFLDAVRGKGAGAIKSEVKAQFA